MLYACALRSVDQSPMAFVVDSFTRLGASSQQRMSREYNRSRSTKSKVERFGVGKISANGLRTKCLELVGFGDHPREGTYFLAGCAKAPHDLAPEIARCANDEYQLFILRRILTNAPLPVGCIASNIT